MIGEGELMHAFRGGVNRREMLAFLEGFFIEKNVILRMNQLKAIGAAPHFAKTTNLCAFGQRLLLLIIKIKKRTE